MLGDDGAILLHCEQRKVLSRLFTNSVQAESTEQMRALLFEHIQTPIYILVDMMQQSYVRHTLPPVTTLGLRKLLQRRLDRDFITEDIKGALSLGRESGGKREWNYLLIALSQTPEVSAWMNFVYACKNPIDGIYLLPVECETYLQQLRQKHPRLNRSKAQWSIIVLHNKVSGIRQVVLRGGKLVFTRLNKPMASSKAETLAGSIEQEISNTLDYLRRQSFQRHEGLEVLIICADDVRFAISTNNIQADTLEIHTPHEVAEILNLQDATLPADRFGDVSIAAAFGNNPRKRLRLHSKYLHSLWILRKSRKCIRSVSAILCCIMALYCAYQWSQFSTQQKQIDTLQHRLERQQTLLTQEQTKEIDSADAKTTQTPKSYQQIDELLHYTDTLSDSEYAFMEFMSELQTVTGDSVTIKHLQWSNFSTLDAYKYHSKKGRYIIMLDFEIRHSHRDWAGFETKLENLMTQMNNVFANYEISYYQMPDRSLRNKNYEVNFSDEILDKQFSHFDYHEMQFTLRDRTNYAPINSAPPGYQALNPNRENMNAKTPINQITEQ